MIGGLADLPEVQEITGMKSNPNRCIPGADRFADGNDAPQGRVNPVVYKDQ